MSPTREETAKSRTSAATRALGAAATIAPLLVAGAHADDAAAKTYKVKNTRSHGKGSLDEAIKRANRHKGGDRVIFRSRLSGDIKVRGDKPRWLTITDEVKILGPGAGRLALRGPVDGSKLLINARGDTLVRGLALKSTAVKVKNSSLKAVGLTLKGKGIESPGVKFSNGGQLKLSRSIVKGFRDRGVAINRGKARIDRSVISGNVGRSNSGGGGISLFYSQTRITKSTISGNRTAGDLVDLSLGGGVFSGGHAFAKITNSTISGNSAVGARAFGGGIFGGAAVVGSTITGNSAGTGGGLLENGYEGVTVQGSIVAGNVAAMSPECGYNPVSQNGRNPFSRGGNVFGAAGCGTAQETDILTAEPGIGPLADNGGPTPTHALLSSSPAIGNGEGSE